MILQYLVRFYQEADLELFALMMAFVVPHGGKDYVSEKFTKFKDNPLVWMCDLTPSSLNDFQLFLEVRNKLNRHKLKFSPEEP